MGHVQRLTRLEPWKVLALAALTGAVIAWGGVLALIWLTTDGDTPPDTVPQPIVERPTLAAVTGTPLPTATMTAAPTESPTSSLTPSPAAPTVTSATATVDSGTPASDTTPPMAESLTQVAQPSSTAAESASATSTATCTVPDGWERYTAQPDDTLFAFVLGADAALTVDDLMAANCLTSRYLAVGQVIFLPPGAAENAPPSVPVVPGSSLTGHGPRTPNCPCTIRIGTGWRREQIADAINAAETMFTGGDFLAATDPGVSAPFDFVMERPAGASMEGYLYPGVYTVDNSTTAEQFRDMALATFGANVTPQMRSDAAAQGVTFFQALTIASIIQREVGDPETQKLVASVLYNRYRDGNRLAQTVTVQYALGGPGNWWPRVTRQGLEVSSPYNSYTLPGLPPGPIANPVISAIAAAVYPAVTNYYYHTAACDGSGTAFAATYEEHLQNVNCGE